MKLATIFSYDTSHRKIRLRNKFYWKLYGCKRRSKFGKYVYEEKGLLSDIKHLKPTESVIIVSSVNAVPLRNFLKSENARFSEHKIILNKREYSRLN